MSDQAGSARSEPEPDSLPPEEATALAGTPLPNLIAPPAPDDVWTAEAVNAVEASIAKLVDDFRFYPFAHRVEHSVHARLFELLREWDILRGWHPLAERDFKSQLIHKEWPETIAETGKKRGSFDLAVLSPDQLAEASVAQFQLGQIAAPIVIELGLGYWDKHLTADEDKMKHSNVQHPFIVHFSRMPSTKRADTEELVKEMRLPTKVAYVHHDILGKQVSFKHLDGQEITTREFSRP
jgi:hypothetical protein